MRPRTGGGELPGIKQSFLEKICEIQRQVRVQEEFREANLHTSRGTVALPTRHVHSPDTIVGGRTYLHQPGETDTEAVVQPPECLSMLAGEGNVISSVT